MSRRRTSASTSFNGPARPADLTFAKAELDRLRAPVLIIAGNHDVGEAPAHSRLDQPLTDERIAAWTDQVGPLWWSRDIGDWRLIGLDTALMASGRPALVFMHMPPFYDAVDDPRPTTSAVPFEARRRLLDLCHAGGVRTIACGHLHIYRLTEHKGLPIVWAPTTAMVHMERQWLQLGRGRARAISSGISTAIRSVTSWSSRA